MRYPILIALFGVSLAAQDQPCTGLALDYDARCGCIKDPNSQLCQLVKAGAYEDRDFSKGKPINLGLGGSVTQPGIRTATPAAQPARPRQARVVPLAHKDYLRFLHPNAHLAAGFDFEKALQSVELMEGLFGRAEGEEPRNKVIRALKEMDHLWLSFAAPNDFIVLMTGKFEQGAAAGMFYAQGVQPVFLGGARVMMIGPEPSIQGALARLAKPAANDGWVTRHARDLSRDHEIWIVNERPAGSNQDSTAVLQAIRQFSLGLRLRGETSIDGEAVADSEAGALKVAAWIDRMKAGIAQFDSLNVARDGSDLRFTAKGDALPAGQDAKTVLNSDFGVELYAVMMAGFPGMPPRTVAEDKLLSVRTGMKREEVLTLLGQPLSVSAIQGLDSPRETWIYQVAFGKQFNVKLDGGVVTVPPR